MTFHPTAKWIELGVIAFADPSKGAGASPFAPWRIDPLQSLVRQARHELARASGPFRVALASVLPSMMARKLGAWDARHVEVYLDLCRAAGVDGYAAAAKRMLQSDTILTKSESERKAIVQALLRAMTDLCSAPEARAVVASLLSSRVRASALAPAALNALMIIDPDDWLSTLLLLEEDLDAHFRTHNEHEFIQVITELLDRAPPSALTAGLLDERLSDCIKRWLFATRVRLRPGGKTKPFLEMLLADGEDRPGAEQLWRNLEIDPDTGAPLRHPQRIAPSKALLIQPELETRWITHARALHDSVNTIGGNRMPWQTEIVDLRRAGELIDQSKGKLLDFIQST